MAVSAEVHRALDRLAAPPLALVERTRESNRYKRPVYRLPEQVVTTLGPAVTYRPRPTGRHELKIIDLVRESGSITSRIVQIALDLEPPVASRLLASLVKSGVLAKTSTSERGPGVTYGPGGRFPATRAAKPPQPSRRNSPP